MVRFTNLAFAALTSLTMVSANCNIEGCLQAIVSGRLAAAGTCFAAVGEEGLNPLADIGCVTSIATSIINDVGQCATCSIAGPCNKEDAVARDHGCSQLGPNHCMQLSSSVPQPSYTDKVLDRYTFHCHNTGLILDANGASCYWKCSDCDQCAGTPSGKRELEAVFWEA